MALRSKKITIIDVAERAGVSIGTVSRVLNNTGGSPETRRRVIKAVENLNYVPNHAAQSLKRQSTEQIAIVVPDFANPVYIAMAKAVQQTAKAKGYSLSLISTEGNSSEEEYAIENLRRAHVDGLILCSLRPSAKLIRELTASRSQVCVIGSLPPNGRVDNVRVDSATGAAQAVQHLVDQGRQSIAFINGTAGTVPASSRKKGYDRALFENHRAPDSSLCISADFTMAGGYAAAEALFERRPDIDAIFCANDVMALGAMRRLREVGRRVPQDVALVGMDDIDLGKVSTPTLTSVTLMASERGRIAAELLFDRLEGDDPNGEEQVIDVMPRLIVRESSTSYIVRQSERDAQ